MRDRAHYYAASAGGKNPALRHAWLQRRSQRMDAAKRFAVEVRLNVGIAPKWPRLLSAGIKDRPAVAVWCHASWSIRRSWQPEDKGPTAAGNWGSCSVGYNGHRINIYRRILSTPLTLWVARVVRLSLSSLSLTSRQAFAESASKLSNFHAERFLFCFVFMLILKCSHIQATDNVRTL